jgi:hypothetical protein
MSPTRSRFEQLADHAVAFKALRCIDVAGRHPCPGSPSRSAPCSRPSSTPDRRCCFNLCGSLVRRPLLLLGLALRCAAALLPNTTADSPRCCCVNWIPSRGFARRYALRFEASRLMACMAVVTYSTAGIRSHQAITPQQRKAVDDFETLMSSSVVHFPNVIA